MVSFGRCCQITSMYIQLPLVDHLVQTTGHYGGMTHCLDILVIAVILPRPVMDPHLEEIMQDNIIRTVGAPDP